MNGLTEIGLNRPVISSKEDHWIPLADIMTGLMMMFLLVALCFMIKVQADADKINGSAATVLRQESAEL